MQTAVTVKTKAISLRQKEIAVAYMKLLGEHILSLKNGLQDKAFEIGDFAEMMHIHPVHLSNTIREVTGRSTCSLFEEKLVSASKELLLETDRPIGEIAMRMTYDPSNFTKFFKHYVGLTPKQFRNHHKI